MIASGYKPQKVSKQISEVAKIPRKIARQPRVKMDFKVTSFLTEFNPLLPELNKLITNRFPLLYSDDPKMKTVFLEKSVKVTLKETLSPSSFPSTENLIFGSISKCNKRCDICTNFMVFDTTFKCTATGKYYNVKRTLSCNSVNVVYLITCQCCKLQDVGSAISFKKRFCIHKSDMNTGKKRCVAAKHFLICCTSEGKFDNLKIQLIESMNVRDILLEPKLWQREKYWPA